MSSVDSPLDGTAHRPDWRRFTETDWFAFAGAEPFANGDEPWVADIEVDGLPTTAIVDATGVTVAARTSESADADDACWAAADGNAILGLALRTSRVELERLGFTKTGGGA